MGSSYSTIEDDTLVNPMQRFVKGCWITVSVILILLLVFMTIAYIIYFDQYSTFERWLFRFGLFFVYAATFFWCLALSQMIPCANQSDNTFSWKQCKCCFWNNTQSSNEDEEAPIIIKSNNSSLLATALASEYSIQ